MRALFSYNQAAQRLGVSVTTLYRWVATGSVGVPYVRLGGRVLFDPDALDDWVSQKIQTQPCAAGDEGDSGDGFSSSETGHGH